MGGGIFAPLNIFPQLICRYKAALTYFLAPYIYLQLFREANLWHHTFLFGIVRVPNSGRHTIALQN